LTSPLTKWSILFGIDTIAYW